MDIEKIALKVGYTPDGRYCFERDANLETFKELCFISKLDFHNELKKKLPSKNKDGTKVISFAISKLEVPTA